MTANTRRILVRVAYCYLIAAGIHTLVVAVGMKPPHFGMGPFVIVFALFFWAFPFLTIYQLLGGGVVSADDIAASKSIMFFIVPLIIALIMAFRHELSTWRRNKEPKGHDGDA